MVFGLKMKILTSGKNDFIGKSISRGAEWSKFELHSTFLRAVMGANTCLFTGRRYIYTALTYSSKVRQVPAEIQLQHRKISTVRRLQRTQEATNHTPISLRPSLPPSLIFLTVSLFRFSSSVAVVMEVSLRGLKNASLGPSLAPAAAVTERPSYGREGRGGGHQKLNPRLGFSHHTSIILYHCLSSFYAVKYLTWPLPARPQAQGEPLSSVTTQNSSPDAIATTL